MDELFREQAQPALQCDAILASPPRTARPPSVQRQLQVVDGHSVAYGFVDFLPASQAAALRWNSVTCSDSFRPAACAGAVPGTGGGTGTQPVVVQGNHKEVVALGPPNAGRDVARRIVTAVLTEPRSHSEAVNRSRMEVVRRNLMMAGVCLATTSSTRYSAISKWVPIGLPIVLGVRAAAYERLTKRRPAIQPSKRSSSMAIVDSPSGARSTLLRIRSIHPAGTANRVPDLVGRPLARSLARGRRGLLREINTRCSRCGQWRRSAPMKLWTSSSLTL